MKTNKFLLEPDSILKKILLADAVAIGASSAIDLTNSYRQEIRARRQREVLEKEEEKKRKEALKHKNDVIINESQINLFVNDSLPQKLFQNRSNHSNTWGGIRY